MTTYRIRGQVLKDGKPSAQESIGLRVEAWDKDERFDDRLGVAKTDSNASFEIEFTDEDFQQDSLERDWIPDVFFEVYRNKQLIGSTEEEEIPEIAWKYALAVYEQSSFQPKDLVLNVKLDGDPTGYSIQILAAGWVPEPTITVEKAEPIAYEKDQVIDLLPTLDRIAPASGMGSSLATVESPSGSLQQIVDSAFNKVLCRSSKNDPKAFVSSLTKSFAPQESNGRTDYIWKPCSYTTIQTDDLGGTVSGAQGSLYHRAKTAIDDALKLLDRLSPLNPAADPQNMEALRSVVRTQMMGLVEEMGTPGGPRAQRVDSLFQLLLGDENNGNSSDKISGQLKDLADIFGLTRDRINTVEEEQNFSNYLIIKDHLISLRASWNDFKQNSGGGAFIGTQLVLLSQALSVVAESVQETYRIMDSVFLGPAERQAVWIDFTKARAPKNSLTPTSANPLEQDTDPAFPLPDGTAYTVGLTKQLKPAMSLAKLLSWPLDWSTNEARTIAMASGKLGIAKSIAKTANELMILLQAASFVPVPNTAFRRAGVIRALRDLAFQVYQVKRLAEELIPPLTGDRATDADDVKDLLQDIRDLLQQDSRLRDLLQQDSRLLDRARSRFGLQ